MGDFVELIFGLAMLAFILFMIISIPLSIINDSKKQKARRRRNPRQGRSYSSFDYTPKEFDYFHQSERGEFFVYFIANEKLGALKIGVGNSGRIKQLLESFTQKDTDSPNIGWQVLKVAKFSDAATDYESGKINGNEAEKRAHYYWRYVLNLPLYVSEEQMGYSRIRKNDQTIWVLTPGYTETANLHKVCEVSTWNYVKRAPGFIGETSAFSGVDTRELRSLHLSHSTLDIPPNYENFKLVQINHINPKAIEGRSISSSGTPQSPKGASPRKDSEPILKTPKIIAPYTAGGIGIYPCTTPACPWPSASMFESAKCAKCSQE
jgi:hypothetical protein